MNILFIIGGNDKGGVLTWLNDLANELDQSGHTLFFAAAIKGTSYNSLKKYGKTNILPAKSKVYNPKIIGGIPWYSLKTILFNAKCKKVNSIEISKIVDVNKIDKIITIGYNDIPKLITKRKSVSIISVLHTVPRIDTTPFKIKSRIIAYKLSKVNKVVSVGNVIKSRLDKYLKEEIILIPNSCKDFSEFKYKKDKIKKQLNIPLDSICIGSLGRFSKTKGFLELVKVFNILAKDHLNLHCILGGGTSNKEEELYYKEVEKIANESNFSERIHFLGNVNNQEFYPIIDIYLLISINSIESFGLVAIEAMSCNIPVIATGKGGPLEIISHKETGLIAYENTIEEFSSHVSLLLSNKEIHKKITKKARIEYQNKYTNKVWIQNWQNLFKNIS